MNHFSHYFSKGMRKVHFASLLIFFGFGLFGTETCNAQTSPDVVKQEKKFVKVADIPSRAETLKATFIMEHSKFIRQPIASNAKPQIDSLRKKMEELKGFTEYAITKNFGYNFTESFLGKWDEFLINATIPEKEVTTYTEGLVDIGKDLFEERKLWENTKLLISTIDLELPEEIETRTDEILGYLNKISIVLSDSLNRSLKYQNDIIELKIQAQLNRDQLDELLKVKFSSLLSYRTYSLFEIPKHQEVDEKHEENNRFFIQYNIAESKTFMKNEWRNFALLIFPFSLILFGILWVKRRESDLEHLQNEQLEMGKRIFKKPFIASLFFTLLLTVSGDVVPPLPVSILINGLIITSFMLLAPSIIIKALRWSVYFFGVLFMIHHLSELYLLQDLSYRMYHLALNGLLIGFVIWFMRNKKRIVHNHQYDALWFKLLGIISPLFLLALIVSVVANVMGYLYFSFMINTSVLNSFLIGILFGVIYSSISSLFILLVSTNEVRRSVLIDTYHTSIITYGKRLFKFSYYGIWLYFTLQWFLLLNPVIDVLTGFMAFGVETDDTTFTVGHFIRFLLVLIASWALSNFVKVLLHDELLSRINLPKGVALAISSISYYILITIGGFLSLFSLGFNLENLGLMMGALSVGIGFGLQNVVSNFISGLILIFERPITIGDVVKLDDVEGTVINIGIRSSQIKQFNGSTLIVPNSDLISNKVVNRTLDDSTRRVILSISTKPEVDPDTVLKTMLESINGLEGILTSPPIKAYFKGTQDQSKIFDLFYWVTSDVLDMKSKVSIKVHNALKEINIEVTNQKRIEVVNESQLPVNNLDVG